MGSLAERIREDKMDFMGRKINVIPNRHIYGSWKSIWSHQLVPFSFRRTHMNRSYAFGGLLHPLHTVHNFTFDLIMHSVNVDVLQSPEGTIVMQTFRDCEGSVQECYIEPMSLSKFEHHCTLSFARQMPPPPFELSSLAAPLTADRTAAILLLCSCTCVTPFLMRKSNKWVVIEALLQVVAGLLGKCVDSNGNSRQLLWYTCSLFLAGFLSISYTNILQSSVIVPSMHHIDRTFEEMLAGNFTFEAMDFEWIKTYIRDIQITDSYSTGKSKLMERQEQLAERIVEYSDPTTFSWSSDIEKFSEGKRKVLVLNSWTIGRYKWIPEKINVDMVVGTEQYFSAPLWWSFMHVERGALLKQSVELLKQAGIVSYFLDLHDIKERETMGRAASLGSTVSDKPGGSDQPSNTESRVALVDGLVGESLVLYLYGVLIASAGFIGELITYLF